LESLRPDVVKKREAFKRRIRRISVDKLVFLDESGMNLAMSRSHAWVKRGDEHIDHVPLFWGRKSLTLLGAIRRSGWVVLNTMFATANADRFVDWLSTSLLPKLHRGDVIVMDNLRAHHDARVLDVANAHGVRVIYLPPYSPDLNPIESGWALQKQFVRAAAPREPEALRCVARRARYRVTPRHCRGWFKHAGYSGRPRRS